MRVTRALAISVIAASLGLGAVNAQSYNPKDSPAEFPPASYKGKQYVDSRGCVYIRAGVDGNVTWVPRVTRDRKVICGFKSTFDTPVAGVAAPPKLDKNVVQIQPAAVPKSTAPAAAATTSTAKAVAPAPVKKPTKTVVKAAPSPAPKPTTFNSSSPGEPLYTTPTAAKPQTVAPAKTAPPTTTTAAPRRTSTQPARTSGQLSPCRDGVSTHKGMAVRCGPQSELPYTPGSGSPTAAPPKIRFEQQGSLRRGVPGEIVRVGDVHPDTRVLPRHIYEERLTSGVDSDVPEGYRRVFDDGRFNPRRAEMTFTGDAQMNRLWSLKHPKNLLPQDASQTSAVVVSSKSAPEPAVVATSTRATVSTRSAPADKTLRLAGTPYVQVGTYSDAQAAQSAALKVQRMGVPVRIGKYERAGATQRIVLAGPFTSAGDAEAALGKAQGAGFSGAFLRK